MPNNSAYFSLGEYMERQAASKHRKWALPDELPDNVALLLSRALFVGGAVLGGLLLGRGQIAFVLFSIAFMYVGRRLGWVLSKNVFYLSPVGFVLVLCFLWGVGVAYGIHALIAWQRPNIILKIIFGFMLGGYVAIPNYGLIAESTIPPDAMPKHNLISMLPLWIYIFSSLVFAWLL